MLTFYISGHLDLTKEEFEEHYVPMIENALNAGNYYFVVGDAKGTDTMAQEYLAERKKVLDAIDVSVYHMFKKPRNNIGGWPCIGGFRTDENRDICMTLHSNVDIAWFRPGRENSGTAKNIMRRLNKGVSML